MYIENDFFLYNLVLFEYILAFLHLFTPITTTSTKKQYDFFGKLDSEIHHYSVPSTGHSLTEYM